MIDFSRIPYHSLLGKFTRMPLQFIPPESTLSILQGPNKGFRWIKGSGVNGYWLGSYEAQKALIIAKYTKEGMACYDVGAHAGYYTLMFSRFVGGTGKVFSFEPNPLNMSYLLRHLKLNGITNVTALPVSLGAKETFQPLSLSSSQSRFTNSSRFLSPCFSLDILAAQKTPCCPDLVKIDVEGAELDVLSGMSDLLSNRPVKLFVALDNENNREKVFSFLDDLHYKVFTLEMNRITLKEAAKTAEVFAEK